MPSPITIGTVTYRLLDFSPLVAFMAMGVYVSIVHRRSLAQVTEIYVSRGLSVPTGRGGAWGFFRPAQGDSQELIEIKRQLHREANRKIFRVLPWALGLVIILIMVSVFTA